MRASGIVVLCALALLGCESEGGDGGGADVSEAEPTLSRVTAEVFKVSCAFSSCHAGGKPASGLSLDGSAHGKLVGVASKGAPGRTLVVAGDPDASYLVEKLSKDKPEAGGRMPVNGTLDAERLELVRDWIAAGAKDD
ncbi:MAG: hypothetical protein AMXMBFR64_52500 [Myxococcales bacterium]